MNKKEKNIKTAKKDFISLVVHQLLGPLTRIHLYLEALLGGDIGELKPEQKEYLNEVYQGSRKMVRLVNNLYNILHFEKNQIQTETKLMYLNEAVHSIVDEVKQLKIKRKCNIIFNDSSRKFSKIYIDISLLKNVLFNLLVNAIQYTPANQCKIIIGLEKRKEDFIINIKDNGIGIPKKEQNNIFKKFFRTEKATKMFKDGNGLGLCLTRLIVKRWGGKIWFESEEGKGTVFYFTIPKKGMKKTVGEYTMPEVAFDVEN